MSLVNHQDHLLTEFILKGPTCHVDIFGDWLCFQFIMDRLPYLVAFDFWIGVLYEHKRNIYGVG